MAVDTFIPEIWSARLLSHLDSELVYANLCNRDYEGEIRQYGDTVHINSIGDPTIKDYTKNTDIDAPEDLSTEEQVLKIDQKKYFNISIDDVDKVQARGALLDEAMSRAGYGIADEIDKYIAGLMKAGKIVKGLGTDSTPLNVDESSAYGLLVNMKVALDKAGVPKRGRWVVVPPEYEGYMLLDPRFAYNTQDSNERLETGIVARAAGFEIHVSNNVPNTSEQKYKIMASYNGSTSFAHQITEVKAYSPEKRFADAVKGLDVYGAKVTRDKAIAVATVNFGAGV